MFTRMNAFWRRATPRAVTASVAVEPRESTRPSRTLCGGGRIFALTLVLLTSIAGGAVAQGAPPIGEPPAGRGHGGSGGDTDRNGAPLTGLLVAFSEGASLSQRRNTLAGLGLEADPEVQSPHFVRVRLTPAAALRGDSLRAKIPVLRGDARVRVVEEDYPLYATALPNDERFDALWGMHNTGQSFGTPDADIDAAEAWNTTTGSDSVIVAVIDTGVDYTHSDLTDNILRDANGRVVGHDFANNDNDPMDDEGHGTHCAGTIGARGNNGIGVAGVCWRVKIMPLKFLTSMGSGTTAAAIQCIDWARTHGAHIMSNSYGGGAYSILLKEAIQRAQDAGILFVAAAGNGGRDGLGDNNDVEPHWPSNHTTELDNVIAVASTTHNDLLSDFSNYGRLSVDIAAPGSNIYSTYLFDSYDSLSGTSMATPHVAGAAALLKARYPTLDYRGLKARLLGNVDMPAALAGKTRSGRLNISKALAPDSVAPGTPLSLKVTHRTATALRVQWTAQGDDGATGKASYYEMRVSTSPINATNFDAAPRVFDAPPAPRASGTVQSHFITGLEPGTTYYVAIRARDDAFNPSGVAVSQGMATLSQAVLFSDNVEGVAKFVNDPNGTGSWRVTTEDAASPTRSYTESPGAEYGSNQEMSLVQSTAFAVTSEGSLLVFRMRLATEPNADFLYVEASTDGGTTWVTQDRFSGQAGWRTYSVPLAIHVGQSVKLRFRFTSDAETNSGGVWLDDIRILRNAAVILLEDDAEGAPAFAGPAPWGRTTEQAASPTQSYTDSPNEWYGDNRNDALTQIDAVTLRGVLPSLHYQAAIDTTRGYDFLHVEISTDGGATWTTQRSHSGFVLWAPHKISLHEQTGRSLLVRFRFFSDWLFGLDGVFVDDIRIAGERMESAPTSVLSSLNVSPTSVTGGTGATGTVTLAVAAPTGGKVVTLSSSSPAVASLPASVTVAAGATTATFAVTTSAVAADTGVTITATEGSGSRTAMLTVKAPVLSSLKLGTSTTSYTAVGSKSFPSSVTLTGKAAVDTVVTLTNANAAATVPTSVTVPAGSSSQSFTVTTMAVSANVSGTVSANQGGVSKSVGLTVRPIGVLSVTTTTNPLVGGLSTAAKVTLEAAAAPSSIAVTLTSSNGAVAWFTDSSGSPVSSVTVAAGATSATVHIKTAAVTADTSATLTATANNISKTLTFKVVPDRLLSVALNTTSTKGGSEPFPVGTVTLKSAAPAGGVVVKLTDNSAKASVPSSVTVAAGATTATFAVTTSAVTANTPVTVTAAYGGVSKTASLTLTP
jgi:subtilisin family serine protease